MKTLAVCLTIAVSFAAAAAVQERAHYNLGGAGGIHKAAPPAVWKSLAPGGPDLSRQGSPKVVASGPRSACRSRSRPRTTRGL
jgi:hypothetical protein